MTKMSRKKRFPQVQTEEQVDWAPKLDEKPQTADLRTILERIKSQNSVIGYIIRGPTSASVDIKDPAKIIDYAALSAEAAESSETMSESFDLGKVNSILIEGTNIKVLSFKRGDEQISVFMEKNVDHEPIYKEIR